MTGREKQSSLDQWKEKARRALYDLTIEAARRQGVDIETLKGMKRSDSDFLSKAVLAWDPVQITLEDIYGGKLTCTYDISGTLAGLSQKFMEMDVLTDSQIEEFAKGQNLSVDEAMGRIAFRYVEAEIFAKIKAGRFLHEQLQPALKQMLAELLDDVYLKAVVSEFGFEMDDAAKTYEKLGRSHIQNRKKRSGLVRDPGHPQTRSKEELLLKIRTAFSRQKETPNLARLAKAMNYGGLSGGASALGKLLKRHSINWKKLKTEWKKSQKRT